MHEDEFRTALLTVLVSIDQRLERIGDYMATLDVDVQTATEVINGLVALVGSGANGGVSEADQTALETAITAGQALLNPSASTAVTVAPPA